MIQILGDFQEEILADCKLFTLDLYLHQIPRDRCKHTRYLSVAFVTDYLANLFPTNEEDIKTFERQLRIKSLASYITNELLENSIKFQDKAVSKPIKISTCLLERQLIFVASNCVTKKTLDNLMNFIDELMSSDSDDFYFSQLEKGAEEKSGESRLGFLSMINDYNAKLGWKIEAAIPNIDSTTVTTMVQLRTT